jgi:hypothetical protein
VRHRVPSHFNWTLYIYNCLLNCYQVGLYRSWPWPLTGQHNFHTLRQSSTKTTTLLTTQQIGVPRNSVCRPCEGFLYLQIAIEFYPSRTGMIFFTPIQLRPFQHRFMELINNQRYCLQTSHAEFHQNRTINVEITIGTHIFIRPVCQLMALSTTFGCDRQSKAYYLNSCVKCSLLILRISNQAVYLSHDDTSYFENH